MNAPAHTTPAFLPTRTNWGKVLLKLFAIGALLYLFVLSITLLGASFKLAGKDRYEDARKRKRRVANRMDPFQIAEADLRARQWNLKRRARSE